MRGPIGRGAAWLLAAVLALLCAGCSGGGAQAGADGKPGVIRIGAPVIPGSTSNQSYFGATGVARAKGLFEQEFAGDGIRVEFVGFPNGPMVAQALANEQIDFAGQGDMVSIIARYSGADTRLILPSQRFANGYLAVAPGSGIDSFEQIRGRRVAYAKGNMVQLQFLRVLAEHGLKESDLRSINLSPSASVSALLSGQVDAVFGAADIVKVEEGGARIIYSTKGRPELAASSAILVRGRFAEAHPDIVQRVVDVLVRAAHSAADEDQREAVLDTWATGKSRRPLEVDIEGVPMKAVMSPLFDAYFRSKYARTKALLEKLGTVRGSGFALDEWIDDSYLAASLQRQGLEDFWTPLEADGRTAQGGGADE